MLLNQINAKEPTNIKITSNNEQYEGKEISIKLTDLNGMPVSKEIVNIIITNNKWKIVVDDVLKTNSKGKAKLDLDLKKGTYQVNVTYNGNENYTGNTSTQKLTIKEETKKTTEVNSVDFNQYSEYSPNFGYYKTIETHDEMALIETSNGNYYIFAGDGAYTYGGRDSQGVIQFGEFVGDY